MDPVLAFSVVSAIIVTVWLIGQLRTAAEDVAGGILSKGVEAGRGPRPTIWWLVPGDLDPGALAAGLRDQSASRAEPFGSTNFAATTSGPEPLVQCSTPPGADLGAAQRTVLRAARHLDPTCQIRL